MGEPFIGSAAIARAMAGWLWSRRNGVIAGQSAAALHGAKWVDDAAPAQLAADYEGDHHRNSVRFNRDIRRHECVTERGWIDVRVTSQDTEAGIVRRVRAAWDRRM